MNAHDLFSTFRKVATSRSAGVVLSAAFMGGCAIIPDRTVDSCMKRGGAFNFAGLIAVQSADSFNEKCDKGRDVAIIAAIPSAEGGLDHMAALIAAASIREKSTETMELYKKQLELRGLTHEQVMAAADKLNREAVKGVLVCEPIAGTNKQTCSYKVPTKVVAPQLPKAPDVGPGPAIPLMAAPANQ